MTIQELIDLRSIRALLAVFFNLTDDDDEHLESIKEVGVECINSLHIQPKNS